MTGNQSLEIQLTLTVRTTPADEESFVQYRSPTWRQLRINRCAKPQEEEAVIILK